jgi:hypothetical protein
MSDIRPCLVPKISDYPDRNAKAAEMISWLIAEEIISAATADCVVRTESLTMPQQPIAAYEAIQAPHAK